MMMNGGSCYRSNNSSGGGAGGGAMPPVSKIMARFRPIAPKPASMTPSNKVDAPPASSSSSSTSAKPFSMSSSSPSGSGSKQHGRGKKRSPSDGAAQKSPSSSPRKKLKSCILRPIVPVTKVSPAPLPSAAAGLLNRSFTTTTVENSAFPSSFASSDSSCFINRAAAASSSVTTEPDMGGAVSSSKAPGFTPHDGSAMRMELKTLPLLPEAPLRPPSPCDSSVTSSCTTSSQASGASPERDPTALCLMRPSDDQVVHEAAQNAQNGHFDTGSMIPPREDDAGLDLRLLEQAYTSCPEPVALTDELNRMLWCNPAFTSTVLQSKFDELGSPVPIFSFVLKSSCRVVLWAFWKRLVFQEGGLLPTFVNGPFPTKKPEISGKKPIAPQPVRAVRSSSMYEQWSFDILQERQRRQLC